jgi:WXG100 family type VII secretion target
LTERSGTRIDLATVWLSVRRLSQGGIIVGTKFSVENNAVNAHASNLDTSIAGLNAQAAGFLAAIEGLPGVWQGASFRSWSALTTSWHEAMAQLNSALDDVRSRVGSAGQLYDTHEAEQGSNMETVLSSASWDGTKFRG